MTIKLIRNEKAANFQVNRCGYKRFNIFSEHLVAVECVKSDVELDRPIYIGSMVLNYSKVK